MTIYPFDIKDLRYFLAVAEEENVARAAEQLNVTASPLSRRILDLEQRLGLRLFKHEKKRLKLTPEGRAFVDDAKEFLKQAGDLARKARDIKSGNERPIQIGYVPGAMFSGLLPELIKRFKTKRPKASFRLHSMRSKAQVDAIEQGKIDIAFVHSPPLQMKSGLEIHKIEEDPFSLFVSKQHPIKKPPNPEALEAESWVAFSEEHAPLFRHEFLSACHAFGFDPNIQFQAPDFPSLLGLIESGLGVGVMQSKLSRLCPVGLRAVPLPGFPLTVSVHLVCLQDQLASPVIEFIDEIKRGAL